jgi:hypothetical protein
MTMQTPEGQRQGLADRRRDAVVDAGGHDPIEEAAGVDAAGGDAVSDEVKAEQLSRVDEWSKAGRYFMEAYYYAFELTGCEPIDRILSAVAIAGKVAHHTESWGEHGCDDEIQREAICAAAEVNRLRAECHGRRFDPNLVEQVRELRVERDALRADVERLTKERDEAVAALADAQKFTDPISMAVLAQTERETAERIAAWVEQHRYRDPSLPADIRSGAWRPK